ncbi:hypothetical protein BGZ73_006683 [Actinomortierella ambigua]|nr:hypothetical protein BGZ73_006683 [Actinomortierella ambigua]
MPILKADSLVSAHTHVANIPSITTGALDVSVERQHDEQRRPPAVASGTPSLTAAASRPSSSPPTTKDGNGTSPSNSSSSSSPSSSPSSNSTTVIRGPTVGGSGDTGLIDPRRPVSRLSMLQPKQNTASPPLFAVGNNIVFEWAFDNQTLVFPPANLTIEVSLVSNPKTTWPIANVTGTTTSVIWNTATVNQPPLSMGFYMVSIYDPKLGKQGVATSGHLMPYSDLQIGLYIPEPYIPRSGASTVAASPSSSFSSDISAVAQPPSLLSSLISPEQHLSASSSSSSSLDSEHSTSTDDVSLVLNDPLVIHQDLQGEPQFDHGVHLHKRQGNPSKGNPTATAAQNPPKGTSTPKRTMSSPTASPTSAASAPFVTPTNPPQGGDNALFGVPSKVGSFNLTAGLLIYSAFLVAFCSTIAFATFQRRRYRNQFREQMRLHNSESGRQAGGDKARGSNGGSASGDMSDAALFKQASLSRRALMKDVGPGGIEGAALGGGGAAMAGGARSYEDRERDGRVRFGESDPSALTGRAGGMKKINYNLNNGNMMSSNDMPLEQSIELEYRGQLQDRRDPSMDDNNDYSRPPLQESENYYSSSSSSSAGGYMDQIDNNGNGVQYPRPAYQQSSAYQQQQQPSRSPSPPIFVQRTASSRMPRADLYDGNNIYRSDSNRRPAAAGGGGSGSRRAGAGMGSGSSTPDMYGGSGSDMGRQGSSGSGRGVPARSAARGAPSPTPVVRSNSTRLPPQMRVATPQPSSLSNQTNSYDFM